MYIIDSKTLDPIKNFKTKQFFDWFSEGFANQENEHNAPFDDTPVFGNNMIDDLVDIHDAITRLQPKLQKPFEKALARIIKNATPDTSQSLQHAQKALTLGRRINSLTTLHAAIDLVRSPQWEALEQASIKTNNTTLTDGILIHSRQTQNPQPHLFPAFKKMCLSSVFNKGDAPMLFLTIAQHCPDDFLEGYELLYDALREAPGNIETTFKKLDFLKDLPPESVKTVKNGLQP